MMCQKKFFIICLAVFLLGACSPAEVEEPTQPPTAVVLPTETVSPVPPTATKEPTAFPSLTPTDEVVVDFCVKCHTEKDTLIQTARVEEQVASESEGVG